MTGRQFTGTEFAGEPEYGSEFDQGIADHAGIGCQALSVGCRKVVDDLFPERRPAVDDLNGDTELPADPGDDVPGVVPSIFRIRG